MTDSSGEPRFHQEINLDCVKIYQKSKQSERLMTQIVQEPASCSCQSLLIHGKVLPPSGELFEFNFKMS